MPLKQINMLRRYSALNDSWTEVIDVDLSIPGTPQLAVFCCGFRYIDQHSARTGKVMEHGRRRWFPCVPKIYDPVSGSGRSWQWRIPLCTCGPGNDCFWCIFTGLTAPVLEWTSLPHRCLPCPTTNGTGLITVVPPSFATIAVTGETTGVVINPPGRPYDRFLSINRFPPQNPLYSLRYQGTYTVDLETPGQFAAMIVGGVNQTTRPYYTSVLAEHVFDVTASGTYPFDLSFQGQVLDPDFYYQVAALGQARTTFRGGVTEASTFSATQGVVETP